MNAHSEAVTVSAPTGEVFAFVAEIENLPKWATEFCQELKIVDGAYKVVSPGGELFIEYRTDAGTGVIDIFAGPTREEMGIFPMRVVPLPGGASAILMTMFQAPGMPDEEFRDQAESLRRELYGLARNFDSMTNAMGTHPPVAGTLVSSPLRNRIRVEFEASTSEVWALLGDLTRFPEYSSGLLRVEAKVDSRGACTEYVCHFKPQEEGGESISHRELIRWFEPNRGFASVAEEGNVFGLTNALTLVTIEPSRVGTIMTWSQYYDAEALDMMKAEFDQALVDTGGNLIRRFGGRVVERFVEN